MLINNDTYQRETVSERPIRQPLMKFVKRSLGVGMGVLGQGWVCVWEGGWVGGWVSEFWTSDIVYANTHYQHEYSE